MLIDVADNTNRIPAFQSSQPLSFLRRRGLMGLGQDGPATPAKELTWAEIGTGLNMELLYLINLDRAQSGKPPLDTKAVAPGVNVGLTQETQQLAMLGIAGLLGVFLLAKRR